MKIYLKNWQRQILFLLGLILFAGFALILSTVVFRYTSTHKQGVSSTVVSQGNFNPVRIDTTNNVNTAYSGEVLGAGEYCDAAMDFPYQPLCAEGSGRYDITGGTAFEQGSNSVTIRNNVVLRLEEVTYPAAIFAGTDEVGATRTELTLKDRSQILIGKVDDDSGQLNVYLKQYWADAGGQIKEVDGSGRALLSPDSDNSDEFDENGGSNVAAPYDVNVDLSTNAQSNGSGRLQSVTFEGNILPAQDENANPDVSNKQASLLGGFLYAPNTYVGGRSNDQAGLCDMVDPNSIDAIESSCFVGCKAEEVPFSFVKSVVLNITQWAECLFKKENNEGTCTESALVAIRIDGIFGNQSNCNDGFCSTKMFDTFTAGVNSPNSSRKYTALGATESSSEPYAEPFYIKTECKVSINYGNSISIPCLWDISPLKREYERQVAQGSPNQFGEELSFELYWQLIEEQANALNNCGN